MRLTLAQQLQAAGVPAAELEYRFHNTRRWRSKILGWLNLESTCRTAVMSVVFGLDKADRTIATAHRRAVCVPSDHDNRVGWLISNAIGARRLSLRFDLSSASVLVSVAVRRMRTAGVPRVLEAQVRDGRRIVKSAKTILVGRVMRLAMRRFTFGCIRHAAVRPNVRSVEHQTQASNSIGPI